MSDRVLVVEDDPSMAVVVESELQKAGYQVVLEQDGRQGCKRAISEEFALIILDGNLPSLNGFDICKEVRAKKPRQPILMLTSRSDEIDKVLGLELGADDYITKPFAPREFIARVRALLRRAASSSGVVSQVLTFGPLAIDIVRRRVTLADKQIDLTAMEFDLLSFLASNPGKPFTRDDLMEQVWGYHSSGFDPTVTTQLSRLRSKIEPNPNKPTYILTVRGVGYRFVESEEL